MNFPPSCRGILARFQRPEQLVAAARALEVGGWQKWETFSPHPVPGTECRANQSMISYVALVCGLLGLVASTAMQGIPTAVLYPIVVGPPPQLSFPAFFPIVFESTLLLAAVGACWAWFVMAGLPCWRRPIFAVEEFRKASRDAYFVAVYADDLEKATDFLIQLGGEPVASIPREEW